MKLPPRAVCVKPRHKLARVLVPLDFAPASPIALRYASLFVKHRGSPFFLLHVIESRPFATSDGAMVLTRSDAESARNATDPLERLETPAAAGRWRPQPTSSGSQ